MTAPSSQGHAARIAVRQPWSDLAAVVDEAAEVLAMERFVDVHARAAFAPGKMKKNNLFTTENLFCDVYCFEPGQEQPGHRHADADKVYYVIEGTGRIQVGDEEHAVDAGAAVLAPQGESHQVRNTGASRLKLLVFMAPKPS